MVRFQLRVNLKALKSFKGLRETINTTQPRPGITVTDSYPDLILCIALTHILNVSMLTFLIFKTN